MLIPNGVSLFQQLQTRIDSHYEELSSPVEYLLGEGGGSCETRPDQHTQPSDISVTWFGGVLHYIYIYR